MAWKGCHLSRPARLRLKEGRLRIEPREGEAVELPLEDLAWLVLESPEATLTSALLAACAEAGVMVMVCDGRHLPSGLLLPFHRHFRQAAVARLQVDLPLILRKKLRQALVRRKIENQAAVLAGIDAAAAATLAAMADHVGPGDPDNVEGRAARFHWQHLFDDFARSPGANRANALLDYGYAILRGIIARALVAAGFLPAFGIFHDSAANAFNLADDVIEPYRPLVDRMVLSRLAVDPEGEDLSLDDRRFLVGLIGCDLAMGAKTLALPAAAERTAASLARALEAGQAALLELPSLAPP